MYNSIQFRVDIDVLMLARKYEDRAVKAQAYLDDRVLSDTRPFVPFLQGTLSQTAFVERPGAIVYPQKYARKMYYGEQFNFTKTFHPDAGARWFDRSRAVYGQEWQSGVERILKGGNA